MTRYSPDVQSLYDDISAKMDESLRGLIAPETACVRDAANSENVELLRIFLKHMDSASNLSTIRNAYHEICRFSTEPPAEMITEHGLQMRSIIRAALASEYDSETLKPIYALAMTLTEPEAHRVISIVRRGVVKVDDIHALVKEAGSTAPPLVDGVL